MLFELFEKQGAAWLQKIRSYSEQSELKKQRDERQREFLSEMEQARLDLEAARNNYNFAQEPALLEYYIYEIKAAETRLNYYVKLAKTEALTNEACLARLPFGRKSRGELT